MPSPVILCNAFSLNMLQPDWRRGLVKIEKIDLERVKEIISAYAFQSAIGHADTARVLSSLLEQEVQVSRINVKLSIEHILIVAQFTGARLPEGATTLPEGGLIEWFVISLA